MVSIITERFEYYKKNRDRIIEHDEILLFYPDYYKTKVELEKKDFISKNTIDNIFEKEYKQSKQYKKLLDLNLDTDEIYNIMKDNKDVNYNNLRQIFDVLKSAIINLCELIDYIGHYPNRWPYPKEEEKNPKMEALLEKYDIIVRYLPYYDMDKMQITSDDIVRIINKLQNNLQLLKMINDNISNNDWIFKKCISKEKQEQKTNETIIKINTFPLSDYQEVNKSKREEGLRYLKIQFKNNN